jgi:hypothetical protein
MNIDTLANATTNSFYSSVDLFLGVMFVLFHAGARFNTPPSNRSSTTAARYFAGLFLYCLVTISIYALLVAFPHLLEFSLYKNAIGTLPTQVSLPLLVALLLTALLPRIPFLNSADRWVFDQLKYMSSIPAEVLRLSAELRKDELKVSPAEQQAVRQLLENDGFDPRDVKFQDDMSPAGMWTRLAILFQKIEPWKSDRKMAGYIAASQSELQNLRDRKQSLSSKAKTCFHLVNEDIEGGAIGKTHQATNRYKEDFTEHVQRLTQDTFDFIARGVLRVDLTDSAREHRLKGMGFSIPWPDQFSLNELLLLFSLVCIIMLSGFVLFGSAFSNVSFGAMLIRAIMISVIYSVAVACAVLPKSKWSFATAEGGQVRPIGFYLVAGLISALISHVISLVFNTILMQRLDWAWQRSLLTYPWLLVSFATALITAVMVDNRQWPSLSTMRQRLLEGAGEGTLMFGVTALTYRWLSERLNVDFKGVNLKYLDYELPKPIIMLVMAAVIGFVIGFFIPHWYRLHQKRSEENMRRLPLAGSDSEHEQASMAA